MNRTSVALVALLPVFQAAAAPPAKQAPSPSTAAMEARIANIEANARQRELEIRQQVREKQNPAVQAEFAAMIEELDQKQDAAAPAATVEEPKRAR